MSNILKGKKSGKQGTDNFDAEENSLSKQSIDITEGANAYSTAGYSDTSNKPLMYKSIKRFILAIVLILCVIFAGSLLFVTIKTYYYTTKQTSGYITKAGEIENDLRKNLAIVNDKYITEELKSVFTKDDIYIFSYNLWSYELFVNKTKINSTSALSMNVGDKIYIKEKWRKSILPKEFINIGNLTRGDMNDSLTNHFGVSGKTFQIKETKSELQNTYTIEKLSIKKGDTFKIILSGQLSRRLNFTKDVIVVKVN